jgi:hypothetical protein
MRLVAVLGSLFAVVAAACGGGGNAASSRPPAARTTTSADPQVAARAAVLAAFDEYNRFYVQAIANPKPDDPSLPAHLTGNALLHMRMDLAGFQSTHEGVRLSDVANDPPVIVFLDPARAVINDCTRSIAHYFDLRTGQAQGALPATAPSDAGLEFVFVREAAVWTLSEKNKRPAACQHA